MSNPTPFASESRGPLIVESRGPFHFECGRVLPSIRIAYESWGELNAAGDNAVLVAHALTGEAHAASGGSSGDLRPGWWEGLIGEGKALDPRHHFIVCPNLLGSCYGTSGPSEADPATGRPLGPRFPVATTRDMVRAQKLLLDHLGVKELDLVLGGSLGGMVAWEWAVSHPDFVRRAAPIAGTPQGSPWMIALNEVARRAIVDDPEWRGGLYTGRGPERGLALARMVAMISYRTHGLFEERFGRELTDPTPGRELDFANRFQVESYLRHQGRKLVDRFDARSYITLSRAMDLHDVARGRGCLDEALGRIRADVVVVGIDSDVLYWPRELEGAVRTLQALGQPARYEEIHSSYGHDAFLVECGQLNRIVGDFLGGTRR